VPNSTVSTPLEATELVATENMVSIRGSRIHGWGLFADQQFRKGDVVAEYIGEYVSDAIADLRENRYREQRIQDYQFRIDGGLVSDANVNSLVLTILSHNASFSIGY
jgi:histone-lysine N-methyltransferase SETD1